MRAVVAPLRRALSRSLGPRAMGVPTPTLDLDFVRSTFHGLQGPLSSYITNSIAQEVPVIGGTTGVLRNVAVNGLHKQMYASAAGVSKGWLAEPNNAIQATRSEEFTNAFWTKNGCSAADATSDVTDPLGTNRASKLTAAGAAVANADASKTLSNADKTISMFVKAGSCTQCALRAETDGANTFVGQAWDLSTGLEIAAGTSGITASTRKGIEAYANGWYRVWISHTLNGSANQFRVDMMEGSAIANNITADRTLYVFGSQFETYGYPTSYCVTAGSNVTRGNDFTITLADASWFNQTEGTVMVDAEPFNTAELVGSVGILWSISPATTGTTNCCRLAHSASSFRAQMGAGSGFNADAIAGTMASSFRAVVAYKTNDFRYQFPGAAQAGDTACDVPTSSTRFQIGEGTNDTASDQFHGFIRRISYWPRRLNNDQITSLMNAGVS